MPRTYVVTGAASGIGAATVDQLDAAGHRVIGVDRAGAEVDVDLATSAGRAALVEQVGAIARGAVDAVIACAGTVGRGRTDVEVDYFGAVATLDGLRPLLAAGDQPRALAVVSYAVLEAVDDQLVAACLDGDEPAAAERADVLVGIDPLRPYASAKRALARWVRAAAPTAGWAGAGIAVNSVGPGIVLTPMTAPLLADPGVAGALMAKVPMPLGGMLPPEDVAHLLVTMTEPGFRGVTGQTVFVDGGADCVRRGDAIWG